MSDETLQAQDANVCAAHCAVWRDGSRQAPRWRSQKVRIVVRVRGTAGRDALSDERVTSSKPVCFQADQSAGCHRIDAGAKLLHPL